MPDNRATSATRFYQELHDCIRLGEGEAVKTREASYSYGALYKEICRLSSMLQDYHGARIVLSGEKGLTQYAAIYSIMLSGNTWVPLSAVLPEARNLEVLNAVEPDLILAQSAPDYLVEFARSRDVQCVDIDSAPTTSVYELEVGEFDLDSIAYILFTSGSTGQPKGVPVSHGNFIPFIRNALEIFSWDRAEVFADFHDYSFDISIFYLFCAPLAGGALAPIQGDFEMAFPQKVLESRGVTVWATVPTAIRRLMAQGVEHAPSSIHIGFLCGEPLDLDVIEYCFRVLGVRNLYNFYGLTETGVENFYYECSRTDPQKYREHGVAPIGIPLPGNHVRVEAGGELLIGGAQISPGYLENGEDDRFFERDGNRWFRSGDLVTERDGLFYCRGRLDSQVKIVGYRVDLRDVESNVRALPGVREAACLVLDREVGTEIGCVYVADQDLDPAQLAVRLPAYMQPKRMARLPALPVNASGKLDKTALRNALGSASPPRTLESTAGITSAV